MPLDFPASPSVNDTYTFSGRTWKWNGSGWQLTSEGVVGTTNIANDAITYAQIQNVSNTDKLLGRSTAGAGDIEEITCTAAGRALLDDADAAAQRTTLNVPTRTGGDASGTWGISISGNAATATKLAATKNINGIPFDGSVDINVPDLRGSNGTVLIDGTGVTSAVNYVSLTNAATAGTPTISTAGSDTNIGLNITTKGTGTVSISTGGGNIALRPTAGAILFYDSTNTYYTNLDNGALTANRTLTMPNANVTLVGGTMVPTTGTGATGSWGISVTGNAATATTATNANNLNIAAGTATTNYVLFAQTATGNQAIKTDTGLTYNASTNVLGASISGSSASCTGNSATATTATNCSRQVIAGTGLDGGGTLTANVTLNVSTTYAAVGTYSLARMVANASISANEAVAGSNLRQAGGSSNGNWVASATALSGTWRNMSINNNQNEYALYIRTA